MTSLGIKVAAIVGPTAVGKTSVSLAVAERLGAEIVSVDSMQIYKGMDIGTDKATAEMRARVPHHMIDLEEPDAEITVAEYQGKARSVIEEIAGRGRLPLLVGGSGLYIRAVIDDLGFPPRDLEIRTRLEDEVGDLGPEALHQRLASLDPGAAAKIEPGNARRTVRALEVIEITGRRFSDNDSFDRYESIYTVAIAGLDRPPEQLRERIDDRVSNMIDAGLPAEAKELAPRLGRTARQALGYRQILDAPEGSPEEWQEAIAKATRRFARRQRSWFKADPRIEWFDATAADLADRLVSFFSRTLTLPLQG